MQAQWARSYLAILSMVFFALCGGSVALAEIPASLPDPLNQRIVIDLDGRSTYALAGALEMYREPEAQLLIDDLLQGDDLLPGVGVSKFAPVSTSAIALGQTEDAVWFRARLRNTTPEKLKINWAIIYIFLEQIDYYQVRDGQIIDQLRLGKVVPYSARRVDMEPYIFPVWLASGEVTDVYFRIKSSVPMLIPFLLADDIGIAQHERHSHTLIGMYIGIMAGMVIYNLFLFIAIRDRAYLYYVLFIAFGACVQMALLGVLDQFTPEAVALNRMNGNLSSSLAITFGILFGAKLLEIEYLPMVFQRVVQGCIAFFILCSIGSLANVPNVHIPLTVGVGLMSLMVWWLALWRVKQGSVSARYFFIAWTVWTLGAVVASGLYVGVFPYNGFTLWFSPISSGVLATLLSFSLAAHINIMRRQQHESALEAQRATAESQAKGQFLAQMSHEIRTPMNGVLGMADLLRQTSLDTQQQQYLEIISNSGKALLTIINDILDFSKIAAGKMELDNTPMDLEKLISDSVQLFALPAADKGIFVRALWDEKVPAVVIGDPTRIRQILTNLLSNAYKFTEKGGVTVEVQWVESLPVSGQIPDLKLRIAVTDTGIGISAENQSRLFQAFSQAEASTTRRFGGTGLGLAICKQLAELMGGEVGIRSQMGKGSTFWFTLRVQEDQSSELLMQRQRQMLAVRDLKLCFVEDGRVLLPLQRVLGVDEQKVHAWGQCGDNLAVARPQWVVAFIDDSTSLEQADGIIRQYSGGLRWIVFVPMGFGPDKENRMRAAGALVVTLPLLARAAWMVLAQSTQKQNSHVATTLEGHVLVAEDNSVNQKVITSMLKKLGLTCDVVENGKLAVEKVVSNRSPVGNRSLYALVLMDCEMPEMDGYEAATRIRQFEQEQQVSPLPIIALSAHVMNEHLQAVKACGMNDALAKPINLETLRELLQRHLAA